MFRTSDITLAAFLLWRDPTSYARVSIREKSPTAGRPSREKKSKIVYFHFHETGIVLEALDVYRDPIRSVGGDGLVPIGYIRRLTKELHSKVRSLVS